MHNACRPPQHWANAIQISPRGRLAIYERDGWTCQLCAEPVDPSLDPQDRMAATLDHIAPRALTLFPDDSPENLRLAHRACNSARGIRAA
ncbi:MAG: HNH endonuclease [Ilumatobacteraceae bacterium]